MSLLQTKMLMFDLTHIAHMHICPHMCRHHWRNHNLLNSERALEGYPILVRLYKVLAPKNTRLYYFYEVFRTGLRTVPRRSK
jgi:hypothetical protein